MKLMKTIGLALALSALAAAIPLSAYADRDDHWGHGEGRWRGAERWHGDIRVFHDRDFDHWRGGRWAHEYHDGRWGWWWVVGALWYFYPYAVYPYPDPYTPPVVVVQPQATQPAMPNVPPPPQYWYYCASVKTYYPYVASCPEGWQTVPATPPSAPGQ